MDFEAWSPVVVLKTGTFSCRIITMLVHVPNPPHCSRPRKPAQGHKGDVVSGEVWHLVRAVSPAPSWTLRGHALLRCLAIDVRIIEHIYAYEII